MISTKEILELERRGSFDYFYYEANLDINSRGYGLIRDRSPHNSNICSIAAVGFGLVAMVIGVHRGYISYEEGESRVLNTLNTLLFNVPEINGFFYHFMDMNTGKRVNKSEISIIDTGICICGALVASEYFGNEIKKKAKLLYERVNFNWFLDKGKNQFYMGYSPEKGFSGYWDFYAEQLILYFLGVSSPSHPIGEEVYYAFKRNYTSYNGGEKFINSWFGSLFTYQFSHAFLDFRGKVDKLGVNWFNNSVIATKASIDFSINMGHTYKGLSSNSWGLTPCDGPYGYEGRYGSIPSAILNDENLVDGTVPPCGALGSLVFTPEDSMWSLENYYNSYYERLWGKYGFKDSFNLDKNWFAKDYVAIDKGITLMMIENHESSLIWEYFMNNAYIKESFSRLKFKIQKTF